MKQVTAIIRDRYQLTIPEEIRSYLTWMATRKAVKIVLLDQEKFLVEPYWEKKIDWQEIWKRLEKAKTQGRKISLAKFIVEDREKH